MGAVGYFVTTPDGVRLHVVQVGAGSRVLIVPGIGNEVDFEPLARERTVVFFDVRNRGRSDAVPDDGAVGFPVEVDDIEVVRRHLGVERVDVFGWSYLGLAVGLHAARYPEAVERVVVVCPMPVRDHPRPAPNEADQQALARIVELYDQGLDRTDPVAFARSWRRITAPTRMGDPAAFDRLRGDQSQWPNEWPDHMMAAMQRVVDTLPPDYDHRDEIGRITVPALVVAGAVDRFPFLETAQEWAATIPRSQLVVFPDVGHYPHAEAPDAFFAAVDSFLDNGRPDAQ